MTPEQKLELHALYDEADDLDLKGAFDRAAYERLLAAMNALGASAIDLHPLHRIASGNRLVSTLDLYPSRGPVGRPVGTSQR